MNYLQKQLRGPRCCGTLAADPCVCVCPDPGVTRPFLKNFSTLSFTLCPNCDAPSGPTWDGYARSQLSDHCHYFTDQVYTYYTKSFRMVVDWVGTYWRLLVGCWTTGCSFPSDCRGNYWGGRYTVSGGSPAGVYAFNSSEGSPCGTGPATLEIQMLVPPP